MSIRKKVLNGIARASEKAVKEATNSKSIWIYFEPDMPQKLKGKKISDNK